MGLETRPLLQNLVGAAGGFSEFLFLDSDPELMALFAKMPYVGHADVLSALFET